MVRAPLILLISSLSLSALSFPIHAESDEVKEKKALFFGQDQRKKITNTTDEPWQAIGQLETISGNMCTATLIAPGLVLTAGHCVFAPPGIIDQPVALRFEVHNEKWKYEFNQLTVRVNAKLGHMMQPDGEGWIIPTNAAPYDYALVYFTGGTDLPIKPLSLWPGNKTELNQLLKQYQYRVTQAGYPLDHLDDLYSHSQCLITGWAQKGILAHRCNTLPGDSGSPLLINTPQGWQIIGIQSSAPPAEERHLADNRALAITGFRAGLEKLEQVTANPEVSPTTAPDTHKSASESPHP